MRRELIISYASHALLIVIFMFASAFSKPKEPPQRVYSVRILAAPQPETVEKVDQAPEEEPQPQNVIQAVPEPKPTPKPKPKPEPKPQKAEKPASKPKETSTAGDGHITVDGTFNDDFYLNLVYMKVYRNWIPPATSAELKTTIFFRIKRNGDVEGAKIENRSGVSSYDQLALRTILTSAPFPELPDHHRGDHLGIHFEFVHNP